LEGAIVKFNFKVIKKQDISNFDIKGEIFLTVTPNVDLKRLALGSTIDYLEFLCIVAIGLIPVDVGAINNESNRAVEFVSALLCQSTILFVLLLELD
jgi:hypothetical protein